jgi:hypothetical protein
MQGKPMTMGATGEVVHLMNLQKSKGGHLIYVRGKHGARMISITCIVNLNPEGFYPESVERMKANGQAAWDAVLS